MLPNFNSYIPSLEPGQDLAGDTLALIHSRRHDNNNGYKDEEEDFYTNNTQNGINKGMDSNKKNNEQVCC